MALVRFKDGQIIETDRFTGLQKWKNYDTEQLFVSVNTMDGAFNFECKSENNQDDTLMTISKQLEQYLNLIDLVDLNIDTNVQKIN